MGGDKKGFLRRQGVRMMIIAEVTAFDNLAELIETAEDFTTFVREAGVA